MEFRQSLRLLIERGFAVVALIVLLGAFQGVPDAIERTPEEAAEGSRAFRMVVGLIYLVALLLCLKRSALLFGLLRRNAPMVLLVSLALASALWSADPMLTLRRAIALCGGTGFALFLVMYFPPERLLRIFAWAVGVTAVLSLLAVLLMPELGIQAGPRMGDWRGVLGHKSILGRSMVLGALAFLILTFQRRGNLSRCLAWIGMGMCLFLAVMSQSRTAWAAGAALMLALPASKVVRRTHWTVALLVIVAAVTVAGIGLQFATDLLFQLLDRDATLTGRTIIWSTALDFGAQRPLLGYGYKAFWQSWPGTELTLIIGNFVGYGHNGYLDLWLELGIVGVGLFVATVYAALRRVLYRRVSTQDPLALWYLGFLAYFLVVNMSSSIILVQNDIHWVLYVVLFYHASLPPGSFYAEAARARVLPGATGPRRWGAAAAYPRAY